MNRVERLHQRIKENIFFIKNDFPKEKSLQVPRKLHPYMETKRNRTLKPSVVFLINSLCEGGAERVLITLSNYFVQQNYDVTILLLSKNNFYSIPKNVNVVYLSKMNDNLLGIGKLFYIPFHAWKLKQYIKNNDIETVQSSLFRANFVNIISGILGAKHNIQVVNHSVVSRFLKEGISGKINLLLIRYLYPKADMVLHISKQMKSYFNQNFLNNKDEKVIYNPHNIESIIQQSKEPIEKFYFDKNKRYLITVGRLIAIKHVEDVINALSRLDSNIELIVLGQGVEESFLKQRAKIKSVENRVHFLGQVTNPFNYMKQSDIFISSSEIEGFPNVLIEAMICKTSVISSDCLSGPREIIAPNSNLSERLSTGMELHQFGILYAVRDVEALVQSIKKILIDKKLKNKLEENGFVQSHRFSVQNIANQYKSVLLRR